MIEVKRTTGETEISLSLSLEGGGEQQFASPLPFLDHMLAAATVHGQFNLAGSASGDVEVDPHHLIEDVGICLGKVVKQYQHQQTAIERSGFYIFPMDAALAQVTLDLSGRSHLVWNIALNGDHSTPFHLAVFREFFAGFCQGARATLHVNVPYLDNDHHAIESVFKAFGKALRAALQVRRSGVAATSKGVIDD